MEFSRRDFIKLSVVVVGAVVGGGAYNVIQEYFGEKNRLLGERKPQMSVFERKWRERIGSIPQRIVIPDGFWYDKDPKQALKKSQKPYYPTLSDNRDADGSVLAIDFNRPDELRNFYAFFEPLNIEGDEDFLNLLEKITRHYKNIKPNMAKKDKFGQACVGTARDTFAALTGLTTVETMFVSVIGDSAIHEVLATPLKNNWWIIDNEIDEREPVILLLDDYFKYLETKRPDWIIDKEHLALSINGDPFNLSFLKPPWLLYPPASHPLPRRDK